MYCLTFLIVCLDYIILNQLFCCSTADLLSTNTPLWEVQAFNKLLQTRLSLVITIFYTLISDRLIELFSDLIQTALFCLPKHTCDIHMLVTASTVIDLILVKSRINLQQKFTTTVELTNSIKPLNLMRSVCTCKNNSDRMHINDALLFKWPFLNCMLIYIPN